MQILKHERDFTLVKFRQLGFGIDVLLYLCAVAVCLPVDLWVWEHVQGHVADPCGHLMFAQQKEDLCQKVQGECIITGQLYGLRTQTVILYVMVKMYEGTN